MKIGNLSISGMRIGKRFIYGAAETLGVFRYLMGDRRPGQLRILTYHGICADGQCGQDWVPGHFVTKSQFEAQMRFLAEEMRPVPLSIGLAELASQAPGSHKNVAVTFDDGYDNNLTLALPILEKYCVPATIFLSTNWIEEQCLFPFDRLRLVESWARRELVHTSGFPYGTHKKVSIHRVMEHLSRVWPACESLLTEQQWNTLKPLSWATISSVKSRWVEFGAHTHHHAILGNETREFRRTEVVRSAQMVRAKTGQREVAFCYPNGQKGDFDEQDQANVRDAGCYCALSNQIGTNLPGTNLYALRRSSIDLNCSRLDFLAELSGFRRRVIALKSAETA
jgi:peptidoglycan/xylan/chitin deacetylase (PgdA/CDA1 family)